jgi:hypothetical protein
MRANELRIGNYLFVPGIDREVIVSAMFKSHYVCEDSDGIRFDESLRINYQPIPITEEWLLKFGFIKSSDNNYYKGDKFTIYNRFENFGLIGGLLSWKEFKYVHQLQNLYFALTGKELTHGGNK